MTGRLSLFMVIIMVVILVPRSDAQAVTGEPARRPSVITIQAKQERFKAGDEIRIQVSWKNTSDRPVLAAPVIPTAETSYKVFVEDDNGRLASETTMGRRIRTGKGEQGQETVTVFKTAPLRYLQPGEAMNEEIVLNKLYDLSKPGRYTVRVQSQVDQDGSTKSNTLTITIADTGNNRAK